jgi:methylphosphotriester-DNA--protein-cysteine methyltransferase
MNSFKSLMLIAGLLLTLTGAAGCSTQTARYVVVIEKTQTYHRPDCRLVQMAKTTRMTLREAKAEHLKPCPLCKPDQE